GTVRGEELQLVEALLIVKDRPLLAVELERDAALAAPGASVQRHDTRRAGGELEQDARNVGVFNWTRGTARAGTSRVGLALEGRDPCHRAEQRRDQRHRV